MTDLEQLLAIEAIKHLKARYFYCMDVKDWEGMREVFSADAIFDVRGALESPRSDAVYSDPPISGVDNIVDYISLRAWLHWSVSITDTCLRSTS